MFSELEYLVLLNHTLQSIFMLEVKFNSRLWINLQQTIQESHQINKLCGLQTIQQS